MRRDISFFTGFVVALLVLIAFYGVLTILATWLWNWLTHEHIAWQTMLLILIAISFIIALPVLIWAMMKAKRG